MPTTSHLRGPAQLAHTAPPEPHLPLVVPGLHRPLSQQPFGQDRASHTQVPATQWLPCAHGSVVPHWHRPVAEQLSAAIRPQARQVPPRVPQAASVGVVHTSRAQQPFGQELASQTQAPLTHRAPLPQAGLLPQRQVPEVVLQLSASAGSQLTQVAPPTPQVVDDCATQAPPAQQPVGQDCALHVQTPATQLVPALQAGLAPQRHAPVTEQLSARVASHVTHAAPPAPHAVVDPALVQVEPEQQPPWQLVALQSAQAPPRQSPLLQVWQAAPPVPQALLSVPARQLVPAQQPLGHEVLSQTQAPPTHRFLAGHAGPAPHWQAPVAEQLSAVIPQVAQVPPPEPQLARERGRQVVPAQQPLGHEVALHSQLPPAQVWPGPHAGPAPQAQAPAPVQPSATAGLHAAQAPPPDPHRPREGATHVAPSQQPLGQEVASQMQAPAWQRRPGPQAGPVPHAQVPAAEQPSAVTASQPTQTAPPVPQVASVGALQVAPEQQPLGHEVRQPLQPPLVQLSPLGQVSQAVPPPPQEAGLSPGRQTLFAQQPSGHDVPSQTQVLPMHRWPTAQAAPAPQRQAPAAEQLSDRASHTAQVDPASPQVSSERVAQVAPWQQPLGHELASQMQRPAAQR